MVHLGFEVGTGESVEIPLLNLAVTGQTQRSGKTTTLEALVRRSGVRALTFVTKRGESAFTDARRIQPYFRDRADWQFVTSIIDATLQEKNKFLRPWIIRICRTTRTLGDVQREVRKALEKATGINQGVYTQLDAYLDLIVPTIASIPFSAKLALGEGLNVMDVSGYQLPMQMLFIQSAIDWVNEHESDTVVVVPEAWEFVPEGKGSPVKSSAVTLVRKGSGIGNHVWLDSQDMAGVDKEILRGCPVWLIGVQREANEIKRNLSNIPGGIKKPKAEAVATLERGQFYVCWDRHTIKTYVQPVWMDDEEAREISLGGVQKSKPPARPITPEEPTVTEQEAQRLRDENATLRGQIDQLSQQVANLSRKIQAESSNDKGAEDVPRSGLRDRGNVGSTPASADRSAVVALNGDFDEIYRALKDRLVADAPGIIRVLTIRPELEVRVERKTFALDGSSLKGRIAVLLSKGFFRETKRHADAKREMERTGTQVNSGNMATALKDLVRDGFLTNEDEGYKEVVGMKSRIIEA